jgi:VanZ family protein
MQRWRRSGLDRLIRIWPALLWLGIVAVLSTNYFSYSFSTTLVAHALAWLHTGKTAAGTVAEVNLFLRKGVHFMLYAAGAFVLAAGPMRRRPSLAFVLVVGVAVLDELHQCHLANRTGSPYDVALDATGALFGVFASRLRADTR